MNSFLDKFNFKNDSKVADPEELSGQEDAAAAPQPVAASEDLTEQTGDIDRNTDNDIANDNDIEKENKQEQLLNSFADMLQTEIHQIFDGVDGKLRLLHEQMEWLKAQQAESTRQVAERVNYSAEVLSERFARVIEQQETTIQKQHQATTKFQEDVLYKVQKNLILELIEIADNIRMILQDQEKEENYKAMLEAVQGLGEWVDATLSNNSVRRYQEAIESPAVLDRKRQVVVDAEITEDPAKDGTYVTTRPGYTWSIPYLVVNSDVQLEKILSENKQPKTFSFVIRPEEVIKLKYEESNETNITTEEQ